MKEKKEYKRKESFSLPLNDEGKEMFGEGNNRISMYKPLDHENLVEPMCVQRDECDFVIIEIYSRHSSHPDL